MSDLAGPVLSPLLPKRNTEDSPCAHGSCEGSAGQLWETPGPAPARTIGHHPAPRPQPPTTSGPRALPCLAEGWDQGWVVPNPGLPLSALGTFQLLSETITKAIFCLFLTSEGRPFLPSTWETYSIDGKAQCRPTSSQQPNIQPSGSNYPTSRPGSRPAVPGSRGWGARVRQQARPPGSQPLPWQEQGCQAHAVLQCFPAGRRSWPGATRPSAAGAGPQE